MVVAAKVDEVDGGTYPKVEAWQPHQDSVLEALGEVWVFCVPCAVPILVEARRKEQEDEATQSNSSQLTSHKPLNPGG